MGHKQVSAADVSDVVWICRRVAAALQGDTTIVQALGEAMQAASPRQQRLLRAMREHLLEDGTAARGLIPLGVPSFVWGTILHGELSGAARPALEKVAARLEAERAAGRPGDEVAYSYSLAFGRFGLLLGMGVPILQAIESAAESLPSTDVREAMLAAGEAVRMGADFSEALSRVAADLPPMSIEMLRDGEQDGRLPDALSIVADYLLDEAG